MASSLPVPEEPRVLILHTNNAPICKSHVVPHAQGTGRAVDMDLGKNRN